MTDQRRHALAFSLRHIPVVGMAATTRKRFSLQAKTAPWIRAQVELKQIGEALDAELASGRLDAAPDLGG